ncbi:MAG: hypothetical protein E7290_09905 [Lachnospiraceae bacterium]|nr:hypothetical protein [Lachnospiraceae bacterium]
MVCPFCSAEMEKGVIHSDRYAMKWIAEKDDMGGFFAPFMKGKKLTNLEKDYVDAFYCEACGKIVIDLKVDESNS